MRELTAEEAKALRALRKIAATWPKTLTLCMNGNGSLSVVDTAEAKEARDMDDVESVSTGLRGTAKS